MMTTTVESEAAPRPETGLVGAASRVDNTSQAQPCKFQDAEAVFASLERLRGILAFYVVICHARGTWMGYSLVRDSGLLQTFSTFEHVVARLNVLTRFGHEAVVIFFILSGFSIAHALRFRPGTLRFFARRFLRLYPVKLAAVGWALLVWVVATRLAPELFIPGAKPFHLEGDFANNWAIAQNALYVPYGYLVAPFWSLPHEILFYLLAPMLLLRTHVFLVGSLALWVVGLAFAPAEESRAFLRDFLTHYLILFAMGAVLYQHYASVARFCKRNSVSVAAVCLMLALGVAVAEIRWEYTFVRLRDIFTGIVGVVLVVYFGERKPQSRILAFLGRQSYSLYVSHMATVALCLLLLRAAGFMPLYEPRPWVWLLFVLPSVFVGEVLFRLVELPVRAYLDRTRPSAAR
jgi:peptidoglycan/LPS O-acetylase OafA/YrhL